ncbi:MAG: hypothetical protein M1274_09100 [Actinobacteria bacterium]|nr:hypothetical protein [Actinomycetota bacterium]
MSQLYGGKILWIDLSSGAVITKDTSGYARNYIGGRGINARIMYENVGPQTDALGPQNIIAFGTGPLSGTLFPGCSRTDVMCKSPVTNLIANANVGGDWAAELKYAGFDHVVLTGRAEHPVYLSVRNDIVELKDARHLWGGTTWDTQRTIKAELSDPEVKVLCIGPAGENMSTFATVHSNVGNSASRTGVGAVLGSKNVKALAVRGTGGVAVADPDAFFEACVAAHDTIKGADYYEELATLGVVQAEYAYVLSGIEAGSDAHDGVRDLDPQGTTDYPAFWKEYGHKRTGCMGCPVHCMENYDVPGHGSAVMSCELYTQLTWEVRNFDMHLLYDLVKQCMLMGIDNTSTATMIQFVMQLYDLGIIDESLTDGIRMEWGSKEAIHGALNAMVLRNTEFGDVLAQGMKATAEYFDSRVPSERRGGTSTYEHAMQVNNNPMYGINPRMNAMALGYAIGRRSDCITDLDTNQFDTITAPIYPGWTEEHRLAEVEYNYQTARDLTGLQNAGDPESLEGKAQIVHDMGIHTGLSDMAGTCKWHTKWLFLDLRPEHYAKALTAGLGREVSEDDLLRASLRMRHVERALECKMGRRRENDTIPAKEFGKPVSRGLWKGKLGVTREQLEGMKDEYYTLRGWDLETGVPTAATLHEFGLDDIASDLAERGILPGWTGEDFGR